MDIEQTQETEQHETTTASDELPGRDELIAAVREAGGTEAVDVAAEAAAAGQPPPKVEPPADGVDPDEPPIAAKLRAREKAFAERQEAESYAARKRAEAESEAQRIVAEAKAKAEMEHRAWLEEQTRRFRESPTEQLRAYAKDPQEIVDAVMREGTPEARALREMQKELAEAKSKAGVAEQVKSEFEAWKKQQADEKQQAQVAQIRDQFLTQYATKEAAPYLHARYDAEEIFQKAHALAVQWRKADVAFDDHEIVAYLEHQSKKRFTGLTPQQVGGAAAEAAGKRPQSQANGSRTLSAATGSERRTTPRPLHEMTEAEQRQALIDEVAAARRSIKDAKP